MTAPRKGMVTTIMMGTKRLPLKKLKAVGSWVVWNRLWIIALHRPTMIPPKMLIR